MNNLPFIRMGDNQYTGTTDPMSQFLQSQKPMILQNQGSTVENFSDNSGTSYGAFPDTSYTTPELDINDVIIAPLNTDVRFSNIGHYKGPGISITHSSSCETCKDQSHKINYNQGNIPEQIHENFSWSITTEEDDDIDVAKKSIICKVPTQYACGSCWAVCLAGTISDCLVASGAANWAPNISSTYIMGVLPTSIHSRCSGGNPSSAAEALIGYDMVDTSCIDYSWCSTDESLCKSVDSAAHFDAAALSNTLNSRIPQNPTGCYFPNIEKWVYNIDSAASLSIDGNLKIDQFRNTVRAHILDYGPVIGGFAVLSNFFKGGHTNPSLNGGIYFDRADYNNYSGGPLSFYDNLTSQAQGLHAVSIVGYGVGKNIQYDTNKYGDVPYWHCRNSWGTKWGNCGYFKIAMYPYNMVSQFDHQVYTSIGGPIGGVVIVKATKKPTKKILSSINQQYFSSIKRIRKDEYYQGNADTVSEMNSGINTNILPANNDNVIPGGFSWNELKNNEGNVIIIVLVIFIFIALLMKLI